MSEHVKANPHNQQPVNETQAHGLESSSAEGLSMPSSEGGALQRMANNSRMVRQLMAFQATANASRQVSQLKALQFAANNTPVQRQAASPNRTSLPAQLRAGIEELSGVSMEGVNVHMNSNMPAQMQAYAYAQGSDIHIAPGQEKHLPHEAWHVAQQRQGRVQPTTQISGSPVNDSPSLESEADTMGTKAMQMKLSDSPVQYKKAVEGPATVQRVPADFTGHPIYGIEGSGVIYKNWEALQNAVRAYNVLLPTNMDGRKAQLSVITEAIMKWRIENKIFTKPWAELSVARQQKEAALRGLEANIRSEWLEILDDRDLAPATAGNLAVVGGQQALNDPLITLNQKGRESQGFFKAGVRLYKADNSHIPAPPEGQVCKLLEDKTAPTGKHSNDYYKVQELENAPSFGTKAKISAGFLSSAPLWVKRDDVIQANKTLTINNAHYEDRTDPLAHPLFPAPPTKEDVEQNNLGDCYLLAAVMAIVEAYPHHFPNNMRDNFDGTVTVRLHDVVEGPIPDFPARLITVKKSVVKMNADDRDTFAGGALWVSILEKAYAAAGFHGHDSATLKVHTGSYGSIASGHASVAMEHILGRRAERKEFNEYLPGGDQESCDLTRLTMEPEGKKPPISTSELIGIISHIQGHQSEAWTEFTTQTQPRREQFDEIMAALPPVREELTLHFATFREWIRTNLFPGKRGSGVYATWQINLFRDIAAQVDNGRPVTVSSQESVVTGNDHGGLSGEHVGKGLAGPHAYSVLAFSPDPLPGVDDLEEGQLLWLKIRNPWGTLQDRQPEAPHPGRIYHDKHTDTDIDAPYDAPRTHEVGEGEGEELNRIGAKGTDNPEFWIELSDLTKRFKCFDYA